MSSEWLLKTPTGERNVSFRFTSDYGFGGSCEGFVQPGEITFDGQTQAVQVKRFYRETYDDRGRGFTQDPATEVERSYEWLSRLSRWGFHTLPFFGVLAQNETKMLPMIDLSDSEKFEVHDEKYLHRNAEGEKMLMSLINKKDVFLSFLRSSMLGATYSVDLGNGTAHMLVRDPKTNTGELFVTDVGECELLPSKYKDALPFEELLKIPEEEIIDVLDRLLRKHHPDIDARELFYRYSVQNPQRKEFQDLFYKMAVGRSLLESIHGWGGDLEWIHKKFVRTNFPPALRITKFNLQDAAERFEEISGTKLWDINMDSFTRFFQGDVLLGIDFAYLAVIDARIRGIMKARKAIDADREFSLTFPKVRFSRNGIPKMFFFDNYNESKKEIYKVEVREKMSWDDKTIIIEIQRGWEEAYQTAHSLGDNLSFIRPSEIKGLYIVKSWKVKGSKRRASIVEDRENISNMIPTIVLARFSNTRPLEVDDFIYYLFKGNDGKDHAFSRKIKNQEDLAIVQAILGI